MRDEPGTRGRGRPSEGTRVAVRLPADVLALVDARAEARNEPRAAAIRRLLAQALRPEVRPDGVDRSEIRRMLALSPRDGVRHVADVVNASARLCGAARRRAV